MKKIKLLLLTSTLLLPGMLSLTAKESRIATSTHQVTRTGIKKAIEYNQKHSYVLFNGEESKNPDWAGVKGETVAHDEVSGIDVTFTSSSDSGFKYNSGSTDFWYSGSIKTGGPSSTSRCMKFVIPAGITAVLKMELYATDSREVFIDKQARNYYSETKVNEDQTTTEITNSPYGHLSMGKGTSDFVSQELTQGEYYLNFSNTIYFGKIVFELTGIVGVTFLDSNNQIIQEAAVKKGAVISAPHVDDRLGEKFKHWSLTANGAKFDLTKGVQEDTTLYAVYEECEVYTITFNLNYFGSTSSQVQVNEGEKVAKPEATPKRPGYKFDSWYYNNKEFNFNQLITEDITLFARWVLDSVPSISGPDSLRFGYSKPSDINSILTLYTANDLEDSMVKIKLEEDTYTVNASTIGTYSIKISATDSSGNKVTKDIPVVVYDDVAPTFEGPTKIFKSTSVALTTNDIIKQVKAKDIVDGEVEFEVYNDTYTGYANKVGDYVLTLLAKDKEGNRRTHTINISVSDSMPKVWYNNLGTINVQSNVKLTSDDVVNMLLTAKELKSGYSSIEVISNYTFDVKDEEVELEPNAVGLYSVTIKARYYSGEEVMLAKTINVYESEEALQKKDNWFNKSWKWCYNNIIRNVCNFFIRVYNDSVKLIGHKEWQRNDYLAKVTIYE